MLGPFARLPVAVAAGAALVACGGSELVRQTGGGPGGSGGGAGGSGGSGGELPGGTGGTGPTEPIAIGPSQGAVDNGFTFSAIGSGSDFVGTVSLAGGAGTIELGGSALPAVVSDRQPFKSYFLYQALAVAPDRWYVLWFYCLGGQLEGVYYEGTDGTVLATEGASGGCTDSSAPSAPAVAFPAVSMGYPALVGGFSLEGPAVHYAGAQPGEIELGGARYALLPFGWVDCSLCGEPGWWELHSLLWSGSRACFAIVYLIDGKPSVQLDYAMCLPDLADPFGAKVLEATSTHP